MIGEPLVQNLPLKKTKLSLVVVMLLGVGLWGAVTLAGLSLTNTLGVWAIAALLLIALLAFAGRDINGHWFGVFIDTRNKISLSRLQITLWTVLVLSAYAAVAYYRLVVARLNSGIALEIGFPRELLLAMGISAASFAGSALIKSNKKSRNIRIDAKLTPDAAADRVDKAQKALDEAKFRLEELVRREKELKEQKAATDDPDKQKKADILLEALKEDQAKAAADQVTKERELKVAQDDLAAINKAQGLLHKNDDPAQARWTDLFRGEEIANYKLVDMAKVQMLFFTIVVIGTYAAAVAKLLLETPELVLDKTEFPPFSQTLNALLGISHGTYLSVKTVDHE